jgi:hypothetical protein
MTKEITTPETIKANAHREKVGRIMDKAAHRSNRIHALRLPTSWEASRLATSLGEKYKKATDEAGRVYWQAVRAANKPVDANGKVIA